MAPAPELSLRGAKRRGNLGKAVAFSPGLSCYPPRYCEIATAPLGPRNDSPGSLMPLNPCRKYCQPARRSLSAATDAIGPCILSTPCTNCKCLPEIAPQGHFLALRAQGATSAYGLLAMTNRGPSAILTIACTGCKCVAGRGMPLPYNFPRDLLLSLYTAAAFFSTAAAVFFRRDLRFRPFCDNIRGRY